MTNRFDVDRKSVLGAIAARDKDRRVAAETAPRRLATA